MTEAPGTRTDGRADLERTVTDADTAHAFGNAGVHVLGTPRLVAWIEDAAAAALHAAGLPGGVGTMIHLDHRAPAVVGAVVVVHADLIDLRGRRATFSATATSAGTVLGTAEHTRFVVDGTTLGS